MSTPAAPDALPLLAGWEPTAPRLTWYGPEGERVELSGRVLLNWVTKAANLLATECGVGPASPVLLDLPAHWRLLVWWLGASAVGAEVGLADRAAAAADDEGADVVVTDRPERWAGGAELIAVPLPALARSWPGALPAGAIDGAAELMGQPDVPVFATAAARAPVRGGGDRRLLVAQDPAGLIDAAWSCWRDSGSVVVVADGAASLPRIAQQEGVTPG